ncbi:hypothetical protein [Streptomyces sp. DSM 40750]|uniref:hypothetical protein n=1 Tax=Streptomyces sp. DSM 40750 TaxID=2801030 RepID=UPI00214AB9AF|nr:hypothetical protein [Streptomyces sp. DSM 40750]UUU25303.1 hypothetical protein JIX55_36450 [Streptomyces sp. DSM 40750]
MEKVDARTGGTLRTYKVATGVNGVYLISSESAVIAVMAGDYAVTDLISFDDKGKARASIQPNRDHQVVNCSETFNAVVETCSAIVVGEERLHITFATEELYGPNSKGEVERRPPWRSATRAALCPGADPSRPSSSSQPGILADGRLCAHPRPRR